MASSQRQISDDLVSAQIRKQEHEQIQAHLKQLPLEKAQDALSKFLETYDTQNVGGDDRFKLINGLVPPIRIPPEGFEPNKQLLKLYLALANFEFKGSSEKKPAWISDALERIKKEIGFQFKLDDKKYKQALKESAKLEEKLKEKARAESVAETKNDAKEAIDFLNNQLKQLERDFKDNATVRILRENFGKVDITYLPQIGQTPDYRFKFLDLVEKLSEQWQKEKRNLDLSGDNLAALKSSTKESDMVALRIGKILQASKDICVDALHLQTLNPEKEKLGKKFRSLSFADDLKIPEQERRSLFAARK